MSTERNGLVYDDDGHLIYTGLSPLHEDEDVADDEGSDED